MMEIPSAENQILIIKELKRTEKMSVDDGAYAIEGKWYRKYLRIIGFRNNDPINIKPAPIDNTIISDGSKLKYGLVPNYDYFIITKSLWNLLKNWFGGGPEIHLVVYNDSHSKELMPDISKLPIRIDFGKIRKRVMVDRFIPIHQLKEHVKTIFNIEKDFNIINFANNIFNCILDESKLLNEYLISENQLFIVDCEKNLSQNISYTETSKTSKRLNGLVNLGCTCFMNTGTQCLLHTEFLINYFLSNKVKINESKTTPLCKAFLDLVEQNEFINMSPYTPSNWKIQVSNYAPRFKKFEEEDSHELVCTALNAFFEETENNGMNLRNNFTGKENTKIQCCKCKNCIQMKDDFITLSLNLPRITAKRNFIFVPFSTNEEIKLIEVSSIDDLNSDIYDYQVATYLPDENKFSLGMIDDIGENVVFYILEYPKDLNDLVLCHNNNSPFIVEKKVISSEFTTDHDDITKKSAVNPKFLEAKFTTKNEVRKVPEFSFENQTKSNEQKMEMIRKDVVDENKFVEFLCSGEKERKVNLKQSNVVKLSECLDEFFKPVKFIDYFCDNCNCMTTADKTVELSDLPNILIVHFERFYIEAMRTKKDNRCVDFDDVLELNGNKYEINAVAAHDGDCLEDGHYFAFCIVESKYYRFDDKNVTECSYDDFHSPFAYMLFYKKIQ